MKTIKFLSVIAFMAFSFSAFSQVQVDKQLQMTGGSNSQRQITGVGNPSDSSHAVNVNTVQRNSVVYAADAGAANAYAVTLSPTPSYTFPYPAGTIVHFKALNANTAGATLSVNGLTAASIVKNYNVALVANDIKAGQMVSVLFDGTNFQMLSQLGNASGGSSGGDPTLIYTTNGF